MMNVIKEINIREYKIMFGWEYMYDHILPHWQDKVIITSYCNKKPPLRLLINNLGKIREDNLIKQQVKQQVLIKWQGNNLLVKNKANETIALFQCDHNKVRYWWCKQGYAKEVSNGVLHALACSDEI